jgi:drug/metabolite transporter (DMT)-like permease
MLPGLFFAGDLAVWHWSIKLTSIANATLFANAAPIFVGLVAWRFLGQRFTTLFVAGMILAIGGAGLLLWDSAHVQSTQLLGDVLGLVTALFYAAYLLSVAHARRRYSTPTIMLWSGIAGAAVLLPLAALSGESLVPLSAHGWLVLVGLALVSQAGGQSLITYTLAHLPTTFGAVSLLWQPVAAACLAWAFLGEPLGPRQLVGGFVVLAGIFLAQRAQSAAL